MEYISLNELYYKKFCENKQEFQKEVNKRKNADSAVKLNLWIIARDGSEHQLFFQVLPEFMMTLEKINNYSNKHRDITQNRSLHYAKNLMFDEIYATYQIEGINSSRKEIMEAQHSQDASKRFYSVVRKYQKMLDGEKIRIEEPADIRGIYNELLGSEIRSSDILDGRLFRKKSVNVMDPKHSNKKVHKGINGEENIIRHLEMLIATLNDSNISFLIRVAIFHYYLGYIHPFYDGTGRLSRYISSALINNYIDPLIPLKLSKTILDNVNAYYQSFRTVNDRLNFGDITPFIIMFFDMINKAASSIDLELEMHGDQFRKFHEFTQTLPIKTDPKHHLKEIEVLTVIFKFSMYDFPLPLNEIQDYLELSYQPTKKIVDYWVQAEIVIRTKRTDYKIAPRIMEQIINSSDPLAGVMYDA